MRNDIITRRTYAHLYSCDLGCPTLKSLGSNTDHGPSTPLSNSWPGCDWVPSVEYPLSIYIVKYAKYKREHQVSQSRSKGRMLTMVHNCSGWIDTIREWGFRGQSNDCQPSTNSNAVSMVYRCAFKGLEDNSFCIRTFLCTCPGSVAAQWYHVRLINIYLKCYISLVAEMEKQLETNVTSEEFWNLCNNFQRFEKGDPKLAAKACIDMLGVLDGYKIVDVIVWIFGRNTTMALRHSHQDVFHQSFKVELRLSQLECLLNFMVNSGGTFYRTGLKRWMTLGMQPIGGSNAVPFSQRITQPQAHQCHIFC